MWNKYISGEGQIKVQHENELFTLYFEDLKTLEFGVEPGTSMVKVFKSDGFSCENIGKEAITRVC
jgi:hypothetical protein